jgi:hypothetical protein
MTISSTLKALLAGLAAAAIGTAMAQSTPPNPNSKDAATGAGQQSTEKTPMGTTGTPTNGTSSKGATASGTTGSSATMGASGSGSSSMNSGAASTDTSMTDTAKSTKHAKKSRKAPRADRN